MKLSNISYPWSEAKSQQKKLRITGNRPFMYMHHPKNWQLVYIKPEDDKRKKDRPLLVPKFSILKLEPGINSVKMMGRGVQSNIAIANAQERGFTIIDPEKHDYIRVYPAIRGNYHCDKWTEFEQYGSSLLNTFDHDGYNIFRKNLVRDGVIGLPHKHFMNLVLHENQKLIIKYSQLLHNPNHEASHKKALKHDADLKEAMKKIQEEGRSYYE